MEDGMNMHVGKVTPALTLEHGKSYVGESGEIHKVEENTGNPSWPFKTAGKDLAVSLFWKADGDGYNTDKWNSNAKRGDSLVSVAPLFAVGDKVRATTGWIDVTEGEIYEVAGVDEEGDGVWVWDDVGDKGYMRNHEVERIQPHTHTACAAAEVDNLAAEYGAPDSGVSLGDILASALRKPKFVAGDHVRAVDGTCLLEIGTEHVVTKSNDKDVWIDINTDRGVRNLSYPHNYFVAAAPATAIASTPLTIEAGKFYQTRDGRKVGPMKRWGGCGHPWEQDGNNTMFNAGGDIWRTDGTSDYSPELVAEWPSTPTSIADIVARHSSTGTAIVCLLENGQPKPSTVPFVHGDAAAAEREASRLANLHKGSEFGVYTLGEVKKVDLPPKQYDHEWQRLAARGSKIPAIKALRDMAGVDLAAAKAGVEQFLMRVA